MILVCPSCETRYFADDSAVGKDGRRVRCASCGHSWFAKTQEEGLPAPEPENTGLTREQVERLRQTAAANSAARAGPHAEFRAREHARRKRERSRAAAIAWGVAFVLFGGLAIAAVLLKDQVSEAFPKAASLYRAVGLDVNRFGLVLENVNAKRSFDGTTPVLTVTGEAVNQSEERRDAPQLRVVLRDEDGKEVKEWTDNLGVPSLGPGERIEFSSRFDAPPVETYRLTVTFAPLAGEEPGKGPVIEATGGEKGAPAPKTDEAPKDDGAYEEPDWKGGDEAVEEAHADIKGAGHN
ncbi:MAG TPA: MJ0042-type zinc finger domain-containing protein [Hyphomonadaceae bacterium]|nr:MJ0042-type zinc finger domain-containing protein [Hyphomonadaceae bacterium]